MGITSYRVTLDSAISDEKFQELVRRILVASQQAGTTATVMDNYAASGTDNVNVALT